MGTGKQLLLTCASLLVLHIGLAGARCGLAGYDFDALTGRSYWTVDILHRSNCLVPDGYTANDVEGCKVFFSVCQAVPYLVCQGHANSAICMEVATTNGSFYYYNFGDYQVDDEFMPLSTFVGFGVTRQGDLSTDRLCRTAFSSSMWWECDRMIWDSNKESNDATRFMLATLLGNDNCFLSMEFGYSGACFVSPSSTVLPTKSTTRPTNSTSVSPTKSTTRSTNSTTVPHSTRPMKPTTVSPTTTSMKSSTMSPSTSTSATSSTSHTKHPPVHTSSGHVPAHTTSPPPVHPSASTPVHPLTTPVHPTTNPMPITTEKNPTNPPPTADPHHHKIAGLTAGVVIFALLSIVLVVLLVITLVLTKQRGWLDRSGYSQLKETS